jgi:hypothetical protein
MCGRARARPNNALQLTSGARENRRRAQLNAVLYAVIRTIEAGRMADVELNDVKVEYRVR